MSTIVSLIRNQCHRNNNDDDNNNITPMPKDTSNRKLLLQHTLIEFFATTIFVYFGTLSAVSTSTHVNPTQSVDVAKIFPIAFTFGIMIMCLAYSIGHITGGHMNPGVSLVMFFHRQMSLTKMMCYWFAQFSGAVLASNLLWWSIHGLVAEEATTTSYGKVPSFLGSTTLDEKLTSGNGLLLEIMGSFFFYMVISQTALDSKGIARTKLPAIPIGFALIVVHICLIPFTGCGVNPARTFGPAVVTCWKNEEDCEKVIGDWWYIYFIGPLIGAILVAEVSNLLKWNVNDERNGQDALCTKKPIRTVDTMEEDEEDQAY